MKFEDWRTALLYVRSGYFMFTFDIKFGYHYIGIFFAHATYCGGSRGSYVEFNVIFSF